MRASRITIIIAFLFTSTVLIFTSRRSRHSANTIGVRNGDPRSRILAFQTPLSLFPPNAIISLTDDNTTSFVARPAAFGPLLPTHGLSGQLWIGSGFGEDVAKQGTIISGAEGELGCSDVPGWNDGKRISKAPVSAKIDKPVAARAKHTQRSSDNMMNADRNSASDEEYQETNHYLVNDGTDDHLHGGKHDSQSSKSHADIQSIQEGAEIAGKVVLLSRGGCGFLEKVKWVQRRGGKALIVGDDTKGGPLIQMYARGDTSNVTIPAIFTGWSTAHLLSSLVPTGRYAEDTVDGGDTIAVRTKPHNKFKKNSAPRSKKQTKNMKSKSSSSTASTKKLWWSWLRQSQQTKPASKQWIMVTDYNKADDNVKADPKANIPATPATTPKPKVAPPPPGEDDDFMIGVQDWRDPDLVDPPKRGNSGKGLNGLPSAGQETPGHLRSTTSISHDKESGTQEDKPGLLSRLFSDDTDESEDLISVEADGQSDTEEHEGLWVTLTPTSAASPFFDTLLVLVVSPLITLTVVYALLLLRSRIRRRRWRAPKSVVERLPVRTYQTIPPSATQTRLPSPTSSSPTTPLLSSARPRPRSRTTSGLPEPGVLSRQNSDLLQPPPVPREQHHEKSTSVGGSEWKKYMCKQVECVVCLEEYIDGVSQVMSLPCGHEFHVDCM